MEDLLANIDLDYYRAARLLIVRAEIAQLRRQATALARVDKQTSIRTEASQAVGSVDRRTGLGETVGSVF